MIERPSGKPSFMTIRINVKTNESELQSDYTIRLLSGLVAIPVNIPLHTWIQRLRVLFIKPKAKDEQHQDTLSYHSLSALAFSAISVSGCPLNRWVSISVRVSQLQFVGFLRGPLQSIAFGMGTICNLTLRRWSYCGVMLFGETQLSTGTIEKTPCRYIICP